MSRSRVRVFSGWGLLALTCAAFDAAAAQPPLPQGGEERVEVRLLQVAISVVDPDSSSYRSYPGLTLDQFVIKIDGQPLTPEQQARVTFTPVCASKLDQADTAPRSLIAVVDFNYLRSAERSAVAAVFDEIAGQPQPWAATYKVYGLTRQVRVLTPGFTQDPAELRRVAAAVRQTAFTRASAGNDTPGYRAANDVALDADNPAAALPFAADRSSKIRRPTNEMDAVFAEESANAMFNKALGDYDPAASLAAIQGIMLAHSGLPGRKALVLYTTEAFKFLETSTDKGDTVQEMAPIRELARNGFSIWPVDAEGLARRTTSKSALLSSLAGDTGGAALRNTNRLALALRNAEDQLSCYYLFSLPVASYGQKSVEHDLSVRLDTDRFPALWKLNVQAPGQLSAPDPGRADRERRIAALLSPEDYGKPKVQALIDYPASRAKGDMLPARLRAGLDQLTFVPEGNGVVSRFAVDAVVERDTGAGNEVLCRVGSEDIGDLLVRLPTAPRPGTRVGLAIELKCPFRKDGAYTVRGVITDLLAGVSGGGRSTAVLRRGGAPAWEVLEPRVEASSGLDFVWRPGAAQPERDRDRHATREVSDRDPADATDRLFLRYVLCGPNATAAKREVRHVVVRRDGQGGATIVQTLPPEALLLPDGLGDKPFCTPAALGITELTLEPGSYRWAIVPAVGAASPAVKLQEGGDGVIEGELGGVAFGIAGGT